MLKKALRATAAITIGTALFFVLARYVSIPVYASARVNFQYAILAVFAVVLGPVAGLIIGLVGHMLKELSYGWGYWWSWIIASGVAGFLFGFVTKGVRAAIKEGRPLTRGMVIRFVVGTTFVHLLAWGLVAPVLDVVFDLEYSSRVFSQGLFAFAGNAVTTAVVGVLLLFGYSKIKSD